MPSAQMEIFYHGTYRLFERFDLTHVLEGDGKVKFGFGVYVTSKYESAVHYSACNKNAIEHYVYTVEIPQKTLINHIAFKQQVNPSIISKAEEKLGMTIPTKYTLDGKDFRKYLVKQLTGKITIDGEKVASSFLVSIGVIYICWPYSWKNPSLGENRAILDQSVIRIVKVDKVNPQKRLNFYSIAPFIERYYPQYYSIETYPTNDCVAIRKVKDEWGIFCNFAPAPILYNNMCFKSVEQLFQMLKFKDKDVLNAVYDANNPKMTAKHYEKTHRREDWGEIIVDAMKLCLQLKYDQNEEFRNKLAETKGKYIVEDQTSFPKATADTWGVKQIEDKFVGPNLLGRLLMKLRDNGKLEYKEFSTFEGF